MKRIIQNVAIVTCSIVIAFISVELLAHIFLPVPQKVTIKMADSLQARLEEERKNPLETSTENNPAKAGLYRKTETGVRLRANTRASIENHRLSGRRIEIITNSLGYRNPEIGPKTKQRLLFLGDSITFGDYLLEEETFVRRIETIARQNNRNWETINAGVGSISLKNELAILNETGLSIHPDVVIIGFYLNDFLESPGVYIPRLPFPFSQSRFLHHVATIFYVSFFQSRLGKRAYNLTFSRLYLQKWRKEFEKRTIRSAEDYTVDERAFNTLILDRFEDWGGSWSPYAWEYMRPLFEEFQRLSISHDFQPILLIFPVSYQVEANFVYDYPQQQIKSLGRSLDIPTLDLLPVLREEYKNSKEELFYDRCHHTPYANDVIAKSIVIFLSENGRL